MKALIGDIKRKAASRTGASFVIALVFALAVALVATVAISSAVVNAERAATANQADEQGYYAVTSALGAAGDLVKRDLCTSFSVTVDADRKATGSGGADSLGLRAWAAAQVEALVRGGVAQPKNVVVKASDMGMVSVPDVLVTFTMTNSGVFARACIDVWGDGEVPEDEAFLKEDLVQNASYASFLSKQVASGSSLSGSVPFDVTWTSTEGGE